MSKKKRKRNADLVILWKGKVARVLGQGSDTEVMLLARLVMHKRLSNEEKFLVLEGAIFDVWGQRLTDREEEAKARRKRAREEQKNVDARRDWEGLDDSAARADQSVAEPAPIPLDPAGSSWNTDSDKPPDPTT